MMEPQTPVEYNLTQLYEQDYYRWLTTTAQLLRTKKFEDVDLENLVEEIESLGKQQRQELRNRLGVLLGHLLKWEFQPQNRSKSWFATIREQRRRILDLLEESPSLQPYIPEALQKAYQDAIDLAVRETSLNYRDFPDQCPYSLDQSLDLSFLPAQLDPEQE